MIRHRFFCERRIWNRGIRMRIKDRPAYRDFHRRCYKIARRRARRIGLPWIYDERPIRLWWAPGKRMILPVSDVK